MQRKTAGFWSYVHADNEYEHGRIVRLRDRLEQSISFHTGHSFQIFLDKKDIGWGEKWKERIEGSLDDALLLFPIVTPRYFASGACNEEFVAFQERQAKLGRDDLILPIYYLASENLEGGQDQSGQSVIADFLKNSQYEDFRSLRASEETDPSYAQAIDRLGQRANEVLKRTRSLVEAAVTLKPTNESDSEESSEIASKPSGGSTNPPPDWSYHSPSTKCRAVETLQASWVL
jgi:cobaltochelatase CobT